MSLKTYIRGTCDMSKGTSRHFCKWVCSAQYHFMANAMKRHGPATTLKIGNKSYILLYLGALHSVCPCSCTRVCVPNRTRMWRSSDKLDGATRIDHLLGFRRKVAGADDDEKGNATLPKELRVAVVEEVEDRGRVEVCVGVVLAVLFWDERDELVDVQDGFSLMVALEMEVTHALDITIFRIEAREKIACRHLRPGQSSQGGTYPC
jgi:hypothetical protein